MAMVLDAFASYLQGMLIEMAAEEIHLLLGVSVEIDKMTDKLGDLKNFLADADRRNITDKSVQGWVTELKHAMYDATDILDDYQLKAMERGESNADKGCCNPFLLCIRNPFHAHDMGTRIKALNERLNTIKQRGDAFSFINLGSYENRGQIMHASRPCNPSPETSGELDRSGVVGGKIEEDTRELVAKLLQTSDDVNNNIMLVAIVGVGGIGKTTLAQNVFNEESIQSEFEKKIWLSVNQNFDKIKLLRTAITLAGGNPDGQESLAVLQPILTTALEGKKVLLVMDDLWSHGAWESVLKTPLVKAVALGSRVLITTRDEAVARGMRATWPHHHIDKLSPEDAWSLLKKQVLSNEIDEDHINTLKDIGLKIIEKCGGLPLAVKVMGGLLCQTEMLRRDWEQVVDDSKWSITEMPQELNHAVYLSYEAMPPYLKQCFLYYSLLPKSKRFHLPDVIAMWISEGFIHGNSNDLEETGKRYYKELISRNLIEPDKDVLDQWSCSMHDVVRSFAQYMTRDEALIAHDGEMDILSKVNSQKFLRLSMETTILQSGELEWKSLQEQKSVRTLISIGKIKMNPGDSLLNFSSLRTLYIESEDVAALVESLHQLKHLRYLALLNAEISVLPENIGKMKLLQFIDLSECSKLVNLPDSIVKLGQLRHLDFPGKVSMIPREFRCLTNMRSLDGFPAYVDGDWCSLDELGPLSQLRFLRLVQLENISSSSSAANARLGDKMHMIDLILSCTSKLGDDGLVKEENGVSKEEQTRIEKVFDELCPPASVQYLDISGYFGQQLPNWMASRSMVPLNNLKSLLFSDLACCTQLPNGLCQLPCLQFLQVNRAPCIRSLGTEFLHPSMPAAAPFPRLQKMELIGMVEWEEWEWEDKVQAMPRLEELWVENCKLGRVPPGLASNARALRKLSIQEVNQISCLEKFPSVVELTVGWCPDLERITDLPKVQKLSITGCPKLKSVMDVPALQRLEMEDDEMETVPGYLGDVNPSYLELRCGLTLLTSIAAGESGPEFAKFSHVERVKVRGAYRNSDFYVLHTRGPCSFDTNVNPSFLSRGTLPIFEDAQRLESALKMPRAAFDYVCNLLKENSWQDANKYTFPDGRYLCLEDGVAVALIVLISGETPATVGSSVALNESTVLQVTESFVDAMGWPEWPGTTEMEKIKYKFDKIHGLPNCCGVVHAAQIPFGSQNSDREKNNEDLLMQVVVDSDTRFTDVHFGSSDNMKQPSISHDSSLFEECEKGTRLNGSKLNLSDGRQVGEYVIGDAGCALLPWLLTPYHPENELSDCQVEFNRRHSEAMAVVPRGALERLKDTSKFMHGRGWWPEDQYVQRKAIQSCCKLHNIVIEMAGTTSNDAIYGRQEVRARQVADEDAAMARDILSQHLTSKQLESGGTLTIFKDAQRLESVLKMPRTTFDYVCSLLKESSLEIMSNYFFFDMRFFSLEERVAIALIMLNSGDPPATVGSFLGVNESTVSLVTRSFVDAMCERAMYHVYWPQSDEREKMKSKFAKIHGLPNCCGVLHTTHVSPASRSWDHQDKESFVLQGVVDPDMRFTSTWLGPQEDDTNQSSLLHSSILFKECEKGAWLNGSKLKLSSEEVGEYVIGDAGYPLLPWLLTPYELRNDLPDIPSYQSEFNRRHSAARIIAVNALARFEDTWKFMHGEWRPDNPREMTRAISVCCRLHNIVIGMEEGARMPSEQEVNYSDDQVRLLADEDAVRIRDILSQHLFISSQSEEEQQEIVASSGSGYRAKCEAREEKQC